MKTTYKFLSVLTLIALLTLTFATPALAFDERSGDKVVIKSDEVINDDLYVSAAEFILDGTVKGDMIVFAQSITINGTVEGDLFAAGQVVVINGKVMDDARIAGAGLQVGDHAVIGSDLLVGGASLEMQNGSLVKGELVSGSGQALLAGNVNGNVLAGTAALQLDGNFGGNVDAYVDVTADTKSSPPMNMYMTNIPLSLPSVKPGLTIADNANIAGNLKYTSTMDLPIPNAVVSGKVTRVQPQVSATQRAVAPTSAQIVGTWALNLLRTIITMILFGLLLGWLFPTFMKALPEKVKEHPWGSLGWGALAWAAFFFALFAIILAMIFGGMVFGFLTLGGISGTIIWLGILALFGFTILFVLVTSYLAKIVVGDMMGKWILNRANPALAEHKIWPMVIGTSLLILIIELFRFPLLPFGFFGWLINFSVILCGLGALWIWGREKMQSDKIEQ